MGAWGVKLYQDDEALDIKGIYKTELTKGKTNEEATKKLIEMFDINENEEEVQMFWCILADLQWNFGRLLPNVKEKALACIEKGGDLELWGEPDNKEYEARKKVLDELSEKLKSPQPPEKQIKVRKAWKCDWKIGDVFAYKLNQKYSEGTSYFNKYVVFVKVQEYKDHLDDILSVICVYDNLFKDVPNIEELKEIKYLKSDKYENLDKFYMRLFSRKNRNYKKDNLIYLGDNQINYIDIQFDSTNSYLVSWEIFDFDMIVNFYKYSNNENITLEEVNKIEVLMKNK